jgi:hypothetical protein
MDIGKQVRVIEVDEPAQVPVEIEKVKVEPETLTEPAETERQA